MVTDELTVLGFYTIQKKYNTFLLRVRKMQDLYHETQYNITEKHEGLFDTFGCVSVSTIDINTSGLPARNIFA